MKARATLRLNMPSENESNILLKSLEPEVDAPTSRTKASLTQEGNILTLQIEAEDTVALRSAVNAYLRWSNSILNILQEIQKKK
jgi:tRNA threonylcarbamoyladenosine modification (KEOPS) complex  Pcc1 subunit